MNSLALAESPFVMLETCREAIMNGLYSIVREPIHVQRSLPIEPHLCLQPSFLHATPYTAVCVSCA